MDFHFFKRKKTLEEIHNYWKNPNDGKNKIENFANPNKEKTRSALLLDVIHQQNVSKQSKILELGCNVGRNLNYLYGKGYCNLSGIEINTSALKKMEEIYPDLFTSITIFNNSIEEQISYFSEGEFDIVFTMAVLEHIHSESEWIFQEMSRITNGYLITIEDEKGNSSRHFPRQYGKIFKKIGLKQILEQKCNLPDLPKGFKVRVFTKPRKVA